MADIRRFGRILLTVTLLVCSDVSENGGFLGYADASIQKDAGCGSTKGCVHDCDSSGVCGYINTWVDNGGDNIEFTMKYNTGGQDIYSSIGLSSDRNMGDDSVIECVPNSNTADVLLSYNPGRSNSRLSQEKLGVTLTSSGHADGVLECVFSRKKTFSLASVSRRKRAATDASTYFDLNTDWYLLLAHGTATAGQISKHSDVPVVTSVKADFQTNQDLSATTVSRPLVKAHGIMMVLAWCLSASVGIVLARYYKPVWGEFTLLNEKVWFQFHRLLMLLVLLLVTVSFIMIFVDVGGYSQMSSSTIEKAHPVFGIIVMILTLANPIMAMLRPQPNTPKRPIFNIAHLLVGLIGFIFATVNIFFGLSMKTSNVSQNASYVLYGWEAWQITIALILWLYDCQVHKSDNKTGNSAINLDNPGETRDQKSQLVKKILLVLHVTITFGLSLAISVIIGQS